MKTRTPVTEDDLHALVDGWLDEERAREVHAYLQQHPEQAAKVQAWRDQRSALRHHFSGIMDDPIPSRLQQAALRPPQSSRGWARIAAGLVAGVLCALAGWMVRDHQLGQSSAEQVVGVARQDFATRAAVAHAVYAPDQRRPVEIDAAHQEQLVTWLSKRMGAPMNPPDLRSLGYELEGGRLLPGGQGPVAQFMYTDSAGMRLTLYVSHENVSSGTFSGIDSVPSPPAPNTAFQFAQNGAVNVFYWIDGPFGYALSSYAGRSELARISTEVYRQLSPDS